MNKKKEKVEKAGKSSLKDTIKSIRSKFGDDSIMMLEETTHVDFEALKTGSIGLDFALGIGGLPKGRIVEIYGPESSGKTTLALHVIAEAQKLGMDCAFIDAEHAMDPLYAKRLGVEIDKLLISQPNNGEEGLQIVDALVRGGQVGVVVIDSVAALTPRAVLEGEIGEIKIGALARLMSQSLGILTASIAKSKTIVIFINQTRMNIAAAATWGAPPETTAGGKALKFYASVRLEIKKIQTIKKGEETVGGRARVKVVKNKVAPPYKIAEFDIMFNEGISVEGELLMLGDLHGVVEKNTLGYSWGDTKLGRGYDSARLFLKENPDVTKTIQAEVLAKMKSVM